MIRFIENSFILKNSYMEYVIGIDQDGKLYHSSFLPISSNIVKSCKEQRDRLTYPYPFEVLVNVNYEPLQATNGNRYFWSLSSFRAVYQHHTIETAGNAERLRITLLDETAQMLIHLVYEIYENSPALQRSTEVENISDKVIIVNHISSFVMSNFPYCAGADDRNDMYLHQYKSHWCWEGSHETASFDSLGLYKRMCRNGYTIENTSTWTCKDHFPYFVLEERNSSLFWGVQIEYSDPWRMEIGSADPMSSNWFYMQGGMGNDIHAHWHKTLKQGETFRSPACSMVAAKGKLDDVYNLMHSHQRNVLIQRSNPDRILPVIYNDWQYMYGQVDESRILEQLDVLAGLGVECYVIDAGWYAQTGADNPRSNWWDMAGDWNYDKTRFPRGIQFIADEISSRGMVPGIWCEIEAVGRMSDLYKREDLLFRRGEFFVENMNRRFLYFGCEEGRDYATSIFERLIGYGFHYFKIDYNIDSAPGCTNSGDSLGQGLYENRMGYYRWLAALRKNHPEIIIEHCSSGGMRLDYGMLANADLASITDQESNRFTGNILYNVTRLIHPSQCGNWSALKDDFSLTEYAFTLMNSMMGRMQISGGIIRHGKENQVLLRNAIAFYKQYRHIIDQPRVIYHSGDVPYEDNDSIISYEYCNTDNTMAVVFASRLDCEDDSIRIRFDNLVEGIYTVDSFPDGGRCAYPSYELQTQGIEIRLYKKYTSCIAVVYRT